MDRGKSRIRTPTCHHVARNGWRKDVAETSKNEEVDDHGSTRAGGTAGRSIYDAAGHRRVRDRQRHGVVRLHDLRFPGNHDPAHGGRYLRRRPAVRLRHDRHLGSDTARLFAAVAGILRGWRVRWRLNVHGGVRTLVPEAVEAQPVPLQRHPPRKTQGHGRPRESRGETQPEQRRELEPGSGPGADLSPGKLNCWNALEAPVLDELVPEDVYIFRSPGGVLEAEDDLGYGLVGRGHTFGEGTADLVDELAGCGGVGVEHLEEPVPTNAVRLDPRYRFDARGGPGFGEEAHLADHGRSLDGSQALPASGKDILVDLDGS